MNRRAAHRSARLCARPMPSALVRLPGPRHSSWSATGREAPARSRRARMRPTSVDRLERADQHGGRPASFLGHDVEQEVDAVVQVDVREAGRTVDRLVAPGRTGCRVAGRVVFPDVRLGFDDDTGGASLARTVDEDLAEQVAGNGQRRPVVERAGQPRHRLRGALRPDAGECAPGGLRHSPVAVAAQRLDRGDLPGAPDDAEHFEDRNAGVRLSLGQRGGQVVGRRPDRAR